MLINTMASSMASQNFKDSRTPMTEMKEEELQRQQNPNIFKNLKNLTCMRQQNSNDNRTPKTEELLNFF